MGLVNSIIITLVIDLSDQIIAVSQRVIVDMFNHKYDQYPHWATQVLLPINLQMYIYQNSRECVRCHLQLLLSC